MRQFSLILLCLLLFVIPLENMVVIPGFGTLSRGIGAVCFVAGVITVMSEKEHRPFGMLLVLFLFYICWSALSFLWTIDYESSWKSLKSLMQIFVFMWLVWEFGKDEKSFSSMLWAYVAGCGASCFATIAMYMSQTQISYQRYAAQGFDPNDLGVTLALGVPLGWYLYLKKQGWMSSLSWAYVPLATFVIILTASRTAFIALAITLVYVLVTVHTAGGKLKWLVYMLLPVCVYLIYLYVPSYSVERFVTIPAEVLSGTLNSRLDIWAAGMDAYIERPLHGFGSGSFSSVLEYSEGYRVSAHNVFISNLVGLGLVGFLLLAGMLFSVLAGLRFLPLSEKILWASVFVALGVGMSALSWDFRKPVWLLLILMASHIGWFRMMGEGEEATVDKERDVAWLSEESKQRA